MDGTGTHLARRLATALAWPGLVLVVVAAAACSSRSRSEPRAQDASVPIDAPAIDAPPPKRKTLGLVEDVRERFDRDCPPSLPAYDLSTRRGRQDHWTEIACTINWKAADPKTKDLSKTVSIITAEGRESDPEIRQLSMGYAWSGPRPPDCDRLVDDSVAYVKEAAHLDDATTRRLATAMRQHAGMGGEWLLFTVTPDLEVNLRVVLGASYYCSARVEMDVNKAGGTPMPVRRITVDERDVQ
jgi:hypothetical protein